MDFPTVFQTYFRGNSIWILKKATSALQFVHAAPHVWRHVVRPSGVVVVVYRGTAQASCAHRPCVDVSYNHRHHRYHHYHHCYHRHRHYPHATPHIAAETTTPPPDRQDRTVAYTARRPITHIDAAAAAPLIQRRRRARETASGRGHAGALGIGLLSHDRETSKLKRDNKSRNQSML